MHSGSKISTKALWHAAQHSCSVTERAEGQKWSWVIRKMIKGQFNQASIVSRECQTIQDNDPLYWKSQLIYASTLLQLVQNKVTGVMGHKAGEVLDGLAVHHRTHSRSYAKGRSRMPVQKTTYFCTVGNRQNEEEITDTLHTSIGWITLHLFFWCPSSIGPVSWHTASYMTQYRPSDNGWDDSQESCV